MQTVYDQYWKHIRHVEDEMWSFTRIWAVVITAIFTVIGADLPTGAKVGAGLFGTILSVLGFLTVYTLRVPFFDFYLTIEMIARRDFDLDAEYRRFEDDPNVRLLKSLDVHDILVSIYTLVAGIMLGTIGIVLGRPTLGVAGGAALVIVLAAVYIKFVVPEFEATIDAMTDEFGQE
jgi:hypothetical protein